MKIIKTNEIIEIVSKILKDIDPYILSDLIYDEFGEDVIYNGDGTWNIPENL